MNAVRKETSVWDLVLSGRSLEEYCHDYQFKAEGNAVEGRVAEHASTTLRSLNELHNIKILFHRLKSKYHKTNV
jgi:hypothetical protein